MKYIDNNNLVKLVLVLLFVGCATMFTKHIHSNISASMLFSQNGKPNDQLVALLQKFSLRFDTIEHVVSDTQAQWLRKPNEERWQQEERFESRRNELMPFFKQLGFIDQVEPSKKEYTYALVLGGNVHGFRDRLAFLKKLSERGITFKSIIFLGGQRILDSNIESKEQLLCSNNIDLPVREGWQLNDCLPATEAEMMKMVVDQSALSEILKQTMTFIDTPMQEAFDGAKRRPNTGDTIKSWLNTKPNEGSTLWISSQPHVLYQDSVIKTYMPKNGFDIETVGSQVIEVKIATILDALARLIYQENIRHQA